MCGITGILSINGKPLVTSELEAMNNSIAHRGPDGEGYWIHEKGFVGFGHRRLSILDLSGRGKQPMSYADGRYHITYNGEVFNFIELREQLSQFGYKFLSDTDTEVIMAAYDYWGKDCLQHFNGMWAFAIWDERQQELFLARDHFGIKPLYYLHQPGQRFVFGSETIQFKHLDDFTRTFNNSQLIAGIRNPFYQEGAGLTIYSGINSILPGHYLVFNHGEMQQNRWWNTLSYSIEIPKSYNDQVEQFRSLFIDSCTLRMRSDVSIGSALSGGLDSSSIFTTLHYINQQSKKPITRLPKEWQKAFVAVFPGTVQDETEYARSVINHVGGRAVYWEQPVADLVADLVSYTRRFDAVYSTPIHVVAKVYEEMRNHGIIVSMDGHGVDEMMYGYSGLQLDAAKYALEQGDVDYALDLIDTFVNLAPEAEHASLMEQSRQKVFGAITSQTSQQILKWKLMSSRLKRKFYPKREWLASDSAINLPFESIFQAEFDIPCERDLFSQFHFAPLPSILRNFDKASMMNSIEIRMPFMDHRLVSFVFNLPIKSKLGNGYTKRILRDAMNGILPEQVRTRKTKIGFNAPLTEWIDGPLKEYSLDTVHSISFLNTNFWNGKQIAIDTEKHYKNKNQFNYQLFWRILNTHIINQE